jgi:hypothetical protein
MASLNRGPPSREIPENNFTESEAQMFEFSASYHATASSATPAKLVQFVTAIDRMDADLHRTFISMVERGERNVTIATVEKLAGALKCKMADLMPDSGE